ncbi:MAG: ABC transporter permease [Deltaproteobacteria bacterium]|nr:ABC transporter permease [Deltaproteobacteria bacterium]MBW2307654.1 ABC transporter permease [Deltaproteobacteria bacterium]
MREQASKIYYLVLKDIRTYYLKPPMISWGFMFPGVMILAFYLKNPSGINDLVPGLIAMTVLFGATSVEAVVITFERRVGTLERLLMAPMGVTSIILGKIMGGLLFGLASGFVVLLLAILFLGAQVNGLLFLVGIMVLSAFCFAALGALVSVAVREVFEAMTLSNFLRFPMLFLCGVFFPPAALPMLLKPLAFLLPLTYAVDGMRSGLSVQGAMLSLPVNLVILLIFSLLITAATVKTFIRRLDETS